MKYPAKVVAPQPTGQISARDAGYKPERDCKSSSSLLPDSTGDSLPNSQCHHLPLVILDVGNNTVGQLRVWV